MLVENGSGYLKVKSVILKFWQFGVSLCWQVTKRNKHSSINPHGSAHKKRLTHNQAGGSHPASAV